MTHKRTDSSNVLRAITTAKVWGLATGMLAICIPLSKATDSGVILPITVIAGATASTASIWNSSQARQNSDKVKELEGRMADLETIIVSRNLEWHSRDEITPRRGELE